jgi:hypothetical protein
MLLEKKQSIHAPSRGRRRQINVVAVAQKHRQTEQVPRPGGIREAIAS